MQTYISILRGINVGGNRTVRMEHLRTICKTLGWKNITSYIQSGNIIFQSDQSAVELMADSLHHQLLDLFHFDVPVVVLSIQDWRDIIASNPFSKDSDMDVKFQHITFLNRIPTPEKCRILDEMDFNPEKLAIVDRAVYLYCPNGYGNSKLNNSHLERKLGVTATTRNLHTVNELLSIAEKTASGKQ